MTGMRGVEQTPWSDAERDQLRRLHENGMSQSQMGAHLGRSKNSVHRQLAILGIASAERNPVQPRSPGTRPKTATPRAGATTLPPLPSLSDEWPHPDEFWP